MEIWNKCHGIYSKAKPVLDKIGFYLKNKVQTEKDIKAHSFRKPNNLVYEVSSSSNFGTDEDADSSPSKRGYRSIRAKVDTGRKKAGARLVTQPRSHRKQGNYL